MFSFGVANTTKCLWVSDRRDTEWRGPSDQCLGWRVDSGTPMTVSTAYRWITAAVEAQYRGWEEAKSFALFPVILRPAFVLRYNVLRNGSALPRDSQEIIAPGDYGIYASGMKYQHVRDRQGVLKAAADGSETEMHYIFTPIAPYSSFAKFFNANCVALTAKVCHFRAEF
jgi:hypothetical protein